MLPVGFSCLWRKVLLTYISFLVDTVRMYLPDSLFMNARLRVSGYVQWLCFSLFLLHRECLPFSLTPGCEHLCCLSWILHSSHTVFLEGPGYPGWAAAQWSKAPTLPHCLSIGWCWAICLGFEWVLSPEMALFTLKERVLQECSCSKSHPAFLLSTFHLEFSQENPVIVKYRAYSQLR